MQPTLNDSAKERLHDYKIAFTSIQEHCFLMSLKSVLLMP